MKSILKKITKALRDAAQREGFAMWCPGQLCITTPSMFEELENPFGEEDDKMYPTKVGGSHVDEKKFKNRKECLTYCNKEIGPALLEGLGLGVAGAIITQIIKLGSTTFSIIGIQYAIMTALGGALGWQVLIGFLVARIIWIYGVCVFYCVKNYK